MKTLTRSMLALTAVLAAACSSNPESHIPVEDRSINDRSQAESDPPPPTASGTTTDSADKGPGQAPAVTALLEQSGMQRSRKEYDAAALSLERALRVEPKNPYLWYRLAVLRMEQGNWQQAYVMANKSNSLVNNSPEQSILNWEIIARAMTELGDEQAAREAEQEILRLQQIR